MKNANLNLPAKSDGTTIRQHTDDLIKNAKILLSLGYINKNEYNILEKACEYHDYGKINEDFQKRLKGNLKFDENTEIPHNVLSAFFISKDDLQENYAIVYNAVLNHHFYSDNVKIIQEKLDVIKEKLEDYDVKFKTRSILKNVENIKTSRDAILIKGLLHKCDYSASAGIKIEYPNDFLVNSMENLLVKWKKENISTDFNEMQMFCKENLNENIIITAPTGMGKTEASLLWLDNNKGFYVLPIRTAINCIYDRIAMEIIENIDIQEKISLLHSNNTAFLMEKYQEMDIFEYLSFSKNLTLPISVCTPDQIFKFVFRYKGYELYLAVLSYSKVIIDEIQAYSPELLAYIIYGIHQIVEMGGKFAIFTATLPPFIIDLLSFSKEIPYIQKEFTHNKLRHNVKVLDSEINIDFIYDKFMENEKNDSNKTLIVCNTVKNAQNIFENLKKMLPDTHIFLLHSKFTQNDRAKLEQQILEDGKTSVKKSVMWVTTQIVEASVDIDFDYIFTELSDLNSLFQRLGRCNRKGFKGISTYNCYVFTEINQNLLINKTKNRGFIDREIYNLSKQALNQVDGVLDENLKISLLNECFTLEKLQNSDFIEDFKWYYNFLDNLYVDDTNMSKVEAKFRNIVTKTVIPQNVYEENKTQILKNQDILLSKNNGTKSEVFLKKESAKKIINGFCVNIYPYELKNKIETIKISRFDEIYVVPCVYDERGYIKIDNTQNIIDNAGMFL